MSQITTCPSCGTRFRVVVDQLRISQGWVRCGQCQEVFDATLSLQQVPDAVAPVLSSAPPATVMAAGGGLVGDEAVPAETEADTPLMPRGLEDGEQEVVAAEELPPLEVETEPELTLSEVVETAETLGLGWQSAEAWQVDVLITEPVLETVTARAPHGGDTPMAEAGEVTQDTAAWEPPQGMPASVDVAQAAMVAEVSQETNGVASMREADAVVHAEASELSAETEPVQERPWPDAEVDAAMAHAADTQSQRLADVAQAGESEHPAAPSGWVSSELLPPGMEPSFVRDARRKAWWQKPAVRLVMGALVVVLPCALLLQVALHERSTLVAWQPGWRPALQAMCTALRCEIAPRQDIEAVVVSGSSFSKDAQSQRFQLGLSIQNQSRMAVAVPAVELTLTDAQDQAIVRRVLLPEELKAPQELQAHAEWTTAIPVQTEGLGLQVAGYRVLVFYP